MNRALFVVGVTAFVVSAWTSTWVGRSRVAGRADVPAPRAVLEDSGEVLLAPDAARLVAAVDRLIGTARGPDTGDTGITGTDSGEAWG